jgi:hypothetical protein
MNRAADTENVMAIIETEKKMNGYPKSKQVRRAPKRKVKSEYPPKPRNALCACGCGKKGEDWHHCFFGRRIDFPELNDPRNLVLVNHAEHIDGMFDTWEWKRIFWMQKRKEYGNLQMLQWLFRLPQKLSWRVTEFNNMVVRDGA